MNGRLLHVCDGEWQSCHDKATSRGGSSNPDHRNLDPGHASCNNQQNDIGNIDFRQNCGLGPTHAFGGFTCFTQIAFDALDVQLGSAKPKREVIERAIHALTALVPSDD